MFLYLSVILRGCIPACNGGCTAPLLGRHPPSETATEAGGTHPTGMHSCLLTVFQTVQGSNTTDFFCQVAVSAPLNDGLFNF